MRRGLSFKMQEIASCWLQGLQVSDIAMLGNVQWNEGRFVGPPEMKKMAKVQCRVRPSVRFAKMPGEGKQRPSRMAEEIAGEGKEREAWQREVKPSS